MCSLEKGFWFMVFLLEIWWEVVCYGIVGVLVGWVVLVVIDDELCVVFEGDVGLCLLSEY